MIELLFVISVCFLLIGVNGVCVAAEFAIACSSRPLIDQQVAAGGRRARIVKHFLSDPKLLDRYIATAQIGITIASIGLGMYGEHRLAQLLQPLFAPLEAHGIVAAHIAASVVTLLLMTYFHIALGEMIPKALALQYPERISLMLLWPMLSMKYIFFPLVWSLNWLSFAVLRLFGVRREFGAEHYRSPEDLAIIIDESRGKGMLGGESSRILKDLLEFGDLTASEVMVPRINVVGIPLGITPDKCRELFKSSAHTRYPVYDGTIDRIIGMVHLKDLLRLVRDGRSLTAESVRPVSFLPETAHLDKVLSSMHRGEAQMVTVLDEHGGTAGLVAYEDLFEEVIGEIDEGSERPSISRDEKGRVHALGTARVEEVGEVLGVPLESEEVDTVNGLILMLLDRPPVPGDVVTYKDVVFEVEEIDRRRVKRAMIQQSLK